MKTEIKLYRLAQKIDRYDQEKDGCYWGHILDIVEQTYKLGKKDNDKEEIIEKSLTQMGYKHWRRIFKEGKWTFVK